MLTGTMLDRGVRARVHTSTAFNAFCDIFCDSFAVHHFKDLHGAGSHAFPRALALVVIDGDGDVSFFEFLFHDCSSLLLTHIQ